MTIKVKFEPRDLWVGVYWDREHVPGWRVARWNVYLCLVPCLPIHVHFLLPVSP